MTTARIDIFKAVSSQVTSAQFGWLGINAGAVLSADNFNGCTVTLHQVDEAGNDTLVPSGAFTAAGQFNVVVRERKVYAIISGADPVNLTMSLVDSQFIANPGSGGGGGGDASAANQATQITQLGALTETAPATDTASSGLNGRLQRIAQRLTSLIALFPTSLGQKTMAASLAVTVASDQSALAMRGVNGTTVATDANPVPVRATVASPLQFAAGIYPLVQPGGAMFVSDEPAPLLSEAWDTLDTTNKWTTKLSTGTAAVAAGELTAASSATNLAYGGLTSQALFSNRGFSFINSGFAIKLPNSVIANTARVWGQASVPATPTVAVPVTDGFIYRLDAAGSLFAEVWSAGAAIFSTNITASKPADGVYAGYVVVTRGNTTLFFINSGEVPLAVAAYLNPSVNALPTVILAIAGTSPGSSATIVCSQVAIGDTSKGFQSISDGQFPWRQATIKPASVAPLLTDTALSVTLRPDANGATVLQSVNGFTTTDRSGNLTTGGTSQQAAAALATRKYLSIQNPWSAVETLFFEFGASATTTDTSHGLQPGQMIVFDRDAVPTGTINVNALTTAHKFIVKES